VVKGKRETLGVEKFIRKSPSLPNAYVHKIFVPPLRAKTINLFTLLLGGYFAEGRKLLQLNKMHSLLEL
jgi:hypothetical protein